MNDYNVIPSYNEQSSPKYVVILIKTIGSFYEAESWAALNCYLKNWITFKIWKLKTRITCQGIYCKYLSKSIRKLPAWHLWEEMFCAKANKTTRKSMFFILDVEYLFVSLNEEQSSIKDCLELYPKLSILLWFYLFIIKHKHKICMYPSF